MPRIRMFQTAAGPDGPFDAGKEYNVSGEIGSQYVNAGAAEWVEAPKETATRAAPESREPDTETEVDLRTLRKIELVEMAEERGVEVTRADGEDGEPLKADYVRALSA